MTGAELGYLLLCSSLGEPERKPLTLPQLRTLRRLVKQAKPESLAGDVTPEHLMFLGYEAAQAQRIVNLLSQETLLRRYLKMAQRLGITFLTPVSPYYPSRLSLLEPDIPPVLCLKGDPALLHTPSIALVGNRELLEDNLHFAQEVGRQAARQGYTLVSGGAKGADLAAQEACLEAGGKVVCIVADQLYQHKSEKNLLLCSEIGYDLPFSPQRALHRNKLIHALGEKTFVAQAHLGQGGSWEGALENLKCGWSPVFVFDDQSPASKGLVTRGAKGVALSDLQELRKLSPAQTTFF